ncbi:MAG: hypothetical protein WCR42_01255 [bacterium]
MAKQINKAKAQNAGAQHYIMLLTMAVIIFCIGLFYVIPAGLETFVVSLFAPSKDDQEKIGWVHYEGRVWGSCNKEMEAQSEGKPISKDISNGDYLLDFSWKDRNVTEHGYAKFGSEFYAKAPLLGERGIIIEPMIALSVVTLIFSFAIALLFTMFMPTSLGLMANQFEKVIDDTKVKLRLQTGFSDDIIELLVMPDDELALRDMSDVRKAFRLVWDRTRTEDMASPFLSMRFDDVFEDDINFVYFRNGILYNRIKEFFSDFVLIEVEDLKNSLIWKRNRVHVLKGFRLYMSHHFCEKYQNLTTGLAYGGAAILIVMIGIRGIKFIPPTKPSLLLFSITLEFSMLLLLALTLVYTESEERIDKVLKKMEDANRSSLEALRGQQVDIHQLSNALVGQTADIIKARVEKAIEEYMTSGDHVQKVVAEEIARKIIFSVREDQGYNKSYSGEGRR